MYRRCLSDALCVHRQTDPQGCRAPFEGTVLFACSEPTCETRHRNEVESALSTTLMVIDDHHAHDTTHCSNGTCSYRWYVNNLIRVCNCIIECLLATTSSNIISYNDNTTRMKTKETRRDKQTTTRRDETRRGKTRYGNSVLPSHVGSCWSSSACRQAGRPV